MRDRVVQRVCEWIINTFATKEYRAFCTVVVSRGIPALEDELGLVRRNGKLVRRDMA